MSKDIYYFDIHIDPEQQGEYLTLPFPIAPLSGEIETLTISYHYASRDRDEEYDGSRVFTRRQEINIIDLGLIDPLGRQVGASGSDKTEITVSEVSATPGYTPCRLVPGEWKILIGAYKVAPEGVDVHYEVRQTYKQRRLLKGDLHTHTLASDGVNTAEELGWRALRHGLDFVAITDHNQMAAANALPRIPGVTLIPGIEWTHYQGHANFLGVDRPYDGTFAARSFEETRTRFESARERGALIVANHPFEGGCEFRFDLEALPVDCLEIWNGPMRMSNLQAVALWQSLLAAGKKLPAVGGSDYHRDTPFIFLGGPTTCVYALSAGPGDILDALRQGHAYITYAPNGPALEFTAGEAILGDTVRWEEVRQVEIRTDGLLKGDVVQVVTATGTETLVEAPADGDFQAVIPVAKPGFVRVEVYRSFLPGLPQLPALISNPIYFD